MTSRVVLRKMSYEHNVAPQRLSHYLNSNKTRHSWYMLALFILALLTQAASFYLIPDGQMNDDASYLSRALHLARPDQFNNLRNPTHYSHGWPILLAPFFKFTNQYYFTGRIIAVVLTALSAPLLFVWFRRWSKDSLTSAGLTLLFLNAVQVLRLGSSLMSEPLYFLLILSCFLGVRYAPTSWSFLFLGALSAWNIQVRMEALAVLVAVLAALAFKENRSHKIAFYLSGFLATHLLNRFLIENQSEKSHSTSVLDFFKQMSAPELLSYPFIYLKNVGLYAGESVFGYHHWVFLLGGCLFTALALRLAHQTYKRKNLKTWFSDPGFWWLLIYPAMISPWPYFNARYWPLWAVMSLGFVIANLPKKFQRGLVVLLLLIQIPGSLREYRLNQDAKLFQERIYRPYYRQLKDAERVMTLNYARVETIARVPTSEPISRTDFQSIPIAMAHFGCDVVEWEVQKRHIVTYTNQEARPFPPNTLSCLRNSTLFEPFASCAFSESFRLVMGADKLKQAGSLFSQAMQTQDLSQRLTLLDQALELVYDLPETRIARARTALALDPDNSQAKEELKKVYQQYPSYQDSDNF